MGLADDLYEANADKAPELELDELGIPIVKNADYLAARAIVLDQRKRESEYSIYQLHTRDSEVYWGHDRIKEDYDSLVRLTQFTGTVSAANKVMFWEVLKRHLPKLNRSIIQISPQLFWDMEAGELKTREEIRNESARSQEIR